MRLTTLISKSIRFILKQWKSTIERSQKIHLEIKGFWKFSLKFEIMLSWPPCTYPRSGPGRSRFASPALSTACLERAKCLIPAQIWACFCADLAAVIGGRSSPDYTHRRCAARRVDQLVSAWLPGQSDRRPVKARWEMFPLDRPALISARYPPMTSTPKARFLTNWFVILAARLNFSCQNAARWTITPGYCAEVEGERLLRERDVRWFDFVFWDVDWWQALVSRTVNTSHLRAKRSRNWNSQFLLWKECENSHIRWLEEG